MKIKWLILALGILFILSTLSFPLSSDEEYGLLFTGSGDSLVLKIEEISLKVIGNAVLDDVLLIQGKDTISVEQLKIRGNILSFLALYRDRADLKSLVETGALFDFERLVRSRIRSLAAEGLSGNFLGLNFKNGNVKIKRRWNSSSGNVSLPYCEFMGRQHGKQLGSFIFTENFLNVEYSGKIADGNINASAVLTGETPLLKSLSLSGNGVMIDKLFTDSISGIGKFSFNSTSLDGDITDWTGNGSIEVTDFFDHHSKVLRNLRSTLEYVGVDTIAFDTIGADLRLQKGEIVSDTLFANGKQLSVDASGKATVEKWKYSCSITGFLPEASREKVSSVVWNGLLPDTATGGKIFHGTLRGIGADYDVKVDQRIIKRSVKSFFRNIFKK